MAQLPGIFNDVIGPIMRGPSSSHTAASWRIGKICRELLGETLTKALIVFEADSPWAANYQEQGTVMGMNGGLLGLDIVDEAMKNTETIAENKGVHIQYSIETFASKHPNTVKVKLWGADGKVLYATAVSSGGGAFEILELNGFDVSISGGSHELLIFSSNDQLSLDQLPIQFSGQVAVSRSNSEDSHLLHLKLSEKVPDESLEGLKSQVFVNGINYSQAVLPVVSGYDKPMPFKTLDSLIEFSEKENLDLGNLGMKYEQSMSGLSDPELMEQMASIITIIDDSIFKGLKGTNYSDRILHQQSHLIKDAETAAKIPSSGLINNTLANVTAIMEAKSAMELIVANPTAGSCGTVGGLVKAVSEEIGANKQAVVKAYFAAGLVGAYFAMGPGFSAEAHGCQVECGAASGMAAAAVAQLYGGSARTALAAASMAIQNMLGLICDPVADRVEVPCLGKNISAAMNALSSATMACSGYDAVIPLDEVIETVSRVSQDMPNCVKCSGTGGLAITETAIQLKKSLENKEN